MACGRRAARSVHRLSMARWPYRASGAISVSTTGLVPSGAPETAASIAASTAGRLRWTSAASPAASRLPAGAASAAWTRSQGRPTSAACARMASISTWVTSTTDRAEPAGQRLDGAVGAVGVHAEGEERPGGRALRQPVPGPAAVHQLRARGRGDGGLPGGQALGVGGAGRPAVAVLRVVVDQAEPGVADELVEPGTVRQRRQRGEPGPDPVPDLVRRHRLRPARPLERERERVGDGKVAVVQLVRPGQDRVPGQRRRQPQQPPVAEPGRGRRRPPRPGPSRPAAAARRARRAPAGRRRPGPARPGRRRCGRAPPPGRAARDRRRAARSCRPGGAC